MIATEHNAPSKVASDPLDKHTINMMTWKATTSRAVACAIVRHMMTCQDVLWPDEINFNEVPGYNTDDANCVGLAYRNLARQGIIRHGSSFRRSTAENARGRTIFPYLLESRARAELFLKRNGAAVTPTQGSLL